MTTLASYQPRFLGLAIYLALVIEQRRPGEVTGYTYPLVPLTGPVATLYRFKAQARGWAGRLAAGVAVAGIVWAALKFGLLGG
jgi:hypothetical protein